MTTDQPITRYLGSAERTLRALLDSMIAPAGLTFPEWVGLTILSASGPLSQAQLTGAFVQGKVIPEAEVARVCNRLFERQLIEETDQGVKVTKAGGVLYTSLKAQVDAAVTALQADLPAADLDATRRVLVAVTERAESIRERAAV